MINKQDKLTKNYDKSNINATTTNQKMRDKNIKKARGIVLLILIASILSVTAYAAQKDEQAAIDAIFAATADVEEMQRQNMTTTLENDILTEARRQIYGENYTQLKLQAQKANQSDKKQLQEIINALQASMQSRKVDYNSIIAQANQIRELKLRAYDINDQLISLKLKMDSIDPRINLSEERKMQEEAQALLKDEIYDDAEAKIKDTFNAINKKEAQYTELNLLYRVGKENIINYVKTNWKNLIISVLSLTVIGYLLIWRISIFSTKSKEKTLELEKQVLVKLETDAQRERFTKGSMTKEDYEILMQAYKERTIDIDKEIPILKAKIEKDAAIRAKAINAAKKPGESIKSAASYIVNIPAKIKGLSAKKPEMQQGRKQQVTKMPPPTQKYDPNKQPENIPSKITFSWNKLRKWRLPELKYSSLKSKSSETKPLSKPKSVPIPVAVKRKPLFSIPKIKLPKISIPRVSMPKLRLPKLKMPGMPKVNWPKFRLPKFKLPKFKMPSFKLPKFKPSVKSEAKQVYRVHVPEAKKSPYRWPTFKLPKISMPKFNIAGLASVQKIKQWQKQRAQNRDMTQKANEQLMRKKENQKEATKQKREEKIRKITGKISSKISEQFNSAIAATKNALKKIKEKVSAKKKYVHPAVEKEVIKQIKEKQKTAPTPKPKHKPDVLKQVKQSFSNISKAFQESAKNTKQKITDAIKANKPSFKFKKQESKAPEPKPVKPSAPKMPELHLKETLSKILEKPKRLLNAASDKIKKMQQAIRETSAKRKVKKQTPKPSLQPRPIQAAKQTPESKKEPAMQTIFAVLHNMGLIRTKEERERIKKMKLMVKSEKERHEQTVKLIKQMMKEIMLMVEQEHFKEAEVTYKGVVEAFKTLPMEMQMELKPKIIGQYNKILAARDKVLKKEGMQ